MRRKSNDALEILDRMFRDDDAMRAMVDEETMNLEVACLIHAARERAKLTQQELAELVGTSQPTIARLEDADYRGHSLTMLRRIATGLGQRLELRFVPKRRGRTVPSRR